MVVDRLHGTRYALCHLRSRQITQISHLLGFTSRPRNDFFDVCSRAGANRVRSIQSLLTVADPGQHLVLELSRLFRHRPCTKQCSAELPAVRVPSPAGSNADAAVFLCVCPVLAAGGDIDGEFEGAGGVGKCDWEFEGGEGDWKGEVCGV